MSPNPPSFSLLFLLLSSAATAAPTIGKPDCPTKCGNTAVPYPFGIGLSSGCSISNLFSLTCNDSSTPPRLLIPDKNLEILDIRNDTVRIKNSVASACYDRSGFEGSTTEAAIDLAGTPFSVSDANMLTVVGCDDLFLLMAYEGRNFSGGSLSRCSNEEDLIEGECSGVGCSQINVPNGFTAFVSSIASFDDHVSVSSFNPCGYAFLGDPGSFVFSASDLSDPSFMNRTRENVPMILDWEIGVENCSVAVGKSDFACSGNSLCVDSGTGLGGYRCRCVEGYQGNPYLSPGCIGLFRV